MIMHPPPHPTDCQYRALPGVNWSSLTKMRISPYAYRYWLGHDRPDTPALALGRVTHMAILEPERFAAEVVAFDGTRRGRAWDEFRDENEAAGKTIVTRKEWDECAALAAAVRSNPAAMEYLGHPKGGAEVVLQWTDAATGLPCKGRADWVCPDPFTPGGWALVDLKTARAIGERQFAAEAARYGYHAQLAMYHDGLEAMGYPVTRVVIVAAEKTEPNEVAVFHMEDDGALWAGREEYTELLARVRTCMDTDTWPGRYTGEVTLTLPAWAYPDNDNADGLGIEFEDQE